MVLHRNKSLLSDIRIILSLTIKIGLYPPSRLGIAQASTNIDGLCIAGRL